MAYGVGGLESSSDYQWETIITTTTKPRWVECADKASEVLEVARTVTDSVERDSIVREAGMWASLACVYRDGKERKLE